MPPYDLEARYSLKRGMAWVGYKAHMTETCDDETPHVITHVETTPATKPDDKMLGFFAQPPKKVYFGD
jgi:transposase